MKRGQENGANDGPSGPSERLLARRGELRALSARAQDSRQPVELDQSKVGRLSRMDALQQQSMAKSTRVNAQASLRKVAAALQRIDDCDYGYCCVCDEPIQFERLQVQPEASHCLNCQDRLDQA